MRIGSLKHRVEIHRPLAGERDQYGQPLDGWELVATVSASIEPLSGREWYAAQQNNAETTTRIRMRYRPAMDTPEAHSWRLKHGVRWYHIDGPPINTRAENRELQVMCHERIKDTGSAG